jgi:large subunit ribosomal protein L4
MIAAALRGALSDRVRHGRVHVLAGLVTGEAPSTRTAVKALEGLTERKNLLVVVHGDDQVSRRSLANIDQVHTLVYGQLNAYDVLCADDVVFTRNALDAFLESPVIAKHLAKEEAK